MMGNLVSFPLLCLLNKACYDICCDVTFGSFAKDRKGRFNGDDCVFAGTLGFFDLWREVTGSFGLVVNEEKTGVSRTWGELNSQPFFSLCGLAPKPVISFLRPFRFEPDCLLAEVLEGIKTFKTSVQDWVLNVAMRHEISLRKISLASLSKRMLGKLLRRSWFRRALALGPAPIESTGVERTVDVVVGRPPASRFYRLVSEMSNDVQRDCVSHWEGKKVHPFESRLNKVAHRAATCSVKTPPFPFLYAKGRTMWRFVWPRPVLRFFERFCPEAILSENDCQSEWIDDHPFLTTACSIRRSSVAPAFRYLQSSFSSRFCQDYPLGYA